jgi:triosephosphate isomerase
MKRKPVIAGNWKMFKTRDEALSFIYEVASLLPSRDKVESVICAPSITLRDVVKREGENLRIGAQNMHHELQGAYTGEISAPMLNSYGVEYVILGHSERRQYFFETDHLINLKTRQALNHQITPIVCIGESLEVREAGTTNQLVSSQVELALQSISSEDVTKVILAYEPIWAIGTGKTATSEQANETIKAIREKLESLYNRDVASKVRILYGGSVKPSNIEELLAQSDIDGALIGGASLEAQQFIDMCKKALQ